MGGDQGVATTVPASIDALKNHPELELVLVGNPDVIVSKLCEMGILDLPNRLSIQQATQVVAMDESPAKAMKSKKDSSMRVAINLVHEGKAHACVSSGNTGALMATARFVLRMLPGVDRPAIMALMPNRFGGRVRMLDVGANVDNSAEHLYQFAVMGSIAVQATDDILAPRVGLLNIGHEAIKGNVLVKTADELLKQNEALNYIGYVECDKIFDDEADVLVGDGFVGNSVLKVCEGSIRVIFSTIKESVMQSPWRFIFGPIAKWMLKGAIARYSPNHYNGAMLLGLRGIVIKSHGGADRMGFTTAIRMAVNAAGHNVPERIEAQVAQTLADRTL